VTDSVQEVARRLLDADASGTTLDPITASTPSFDMDAAYEVQAEIAAARRSSGWTPVGRKIGFTNRTLWELYGVDAPMWASVWDRTLVRATDGVADVDLGGLVQPRIEPEVVFGLTGPVPPEGDAAEILRSVGWIAAGFEIVRCPFPGWRFALPDCAAAFGLHGRLVLGTPVAIEDERRDALVASLASFEATLRRGDEVVDRGVGANVLGSPALALGHLARVVTSQSRHPQLAAGEIITTGTITDAWPVTAGETWRSDYGELGIDGLTVTFR
jgi:2-oxo-3-hexenedioate decarboxylase